MVCIEDTRAVLIGMRFAIFDPQTPKCYRKKALRMTGTPKQKYSTGKIVNSIYTSWNRNSFNLC